jgi:hypothetical protein
MWHTNSELSYESISSLIQNPVINRGSEAHTLHILPTLWFRNTWSWDGGEETKPILQAIDTCSDPNIIEATHPTLGKYWLYARGNGELLFTENETNNKRIFGHLNGSPYVKDSINDCIVNGNKQAVNPALVGTKVAIHYVLSIEPGTTQTVQLRLSNVSNLTDPLGNNFSEIFASRKQEAAEFYQRITPTALSEDMRNIQRQAFAGIL